MGTRIDVFTAASPWIAASSDGIAKNGGPGQIGGELPYPSTNPTIKASAVCSIEDT
jgi:hypothetical protein